MDSGHPAAAPIAAVSLGRHLEGQGDLTKAKQCYQTAIDSAHPEQAPFAAFPSAGLELVAGGVGPGADVGEALAVFGGAPRGGCAPCGGVSCFSIAA